VALEPLDVPDHWLTSLTVKTERELSVSSPAVFAGAIPESLALHEALESLDVSDNRLSGLPASWQGATTARINSAPLRNIKLSQNLFGVRDFAGKSSARMWL